MMADAPRLIESRPNSECGCPEEEWVYRNVGLTIHFEPTGIVDAFFDGGDWIDDASFAPASHEEGRALAFAWIDALPTEEEIAARRERKG